MHEGIYGVLELVILRTGQEQGQEQGQKSKRRMDSKNRALRKQSIPRAQKLIGAFEGGEKEDEEVGREVEKGCLFARLPRKSGVKDTKTRMFPPYNSLTPV